ncbi:hypothetical protein PILCRDRAFT_5681 [Piloderma croceum F 1598]|uniref:Alpha/beta hydrolase fold-3 domain-containing protein n=1 Tax=Piloderma croceum (strain F 1598) TaxID=765440 RepID=A0A0C3BGF1_PILCF|nr:hypothetical protein PILCRDRAFT_5681 [Piloderma croceum F 1598]
MIVKQEKVHSSSDSGTVWRCRPFLVNVAPSLRDYSPFHHSFTGQTYIWVALYSIFASASQLVSYAHSQIWHETGFSVTVTSRGCPIQKHHWDKGRNIKVHLYQPAGYDSAHEPVCPQLWIYCTFPRRKLRILFAYRSPRHVILDADYREAPEHTFLAAIQNAKDMTRYLAANSGQYDSSDIFLHGFSAGDNIALLTASTLGSECIKGVVDFYPYVDLTKPHTAQRRSA